MHLKYGEIHPRTLLRDLGAHDDADGPGPGTFRGELAWRDFYADVLFHRPDSAREYYRPELAEMEYATGDTARDRLAAWQRGRTGYPVVDAGMRQLSGEGWMHNRLRMIVGSFLVKDLHLEWTDGARWFMRQLVDGELSSNQHGWQWVAGSGTDAAPYFRIFNPVTQGRRYDPDGDYVRRYVPSCATFPGARCTSRGRSPTPTTTATRARSWTTPGSARSRWPATRRCAADRADGRPGPPARSTPRRSPRSRS